MPRQSFIIDLRFDGGRQAEQVLESIGQTGDRSLSRVSNASQPARRGLLAVDDAARELRDGAGQLADRLGPLGSGMRALGPAGTAAAAGIAAAGAGLVQGTRRAQEATQRFAELGEQADQLGVSVQALQELRFAAGQVGVEEGRLEDGLQELNTRISELQSGAGELNSFLEDLGASGLRQALRGAEDTEDAFNILVRALKESDNAFDNAALAAAAFGEEGGRAVQRVANQDVQELRQAFRDLGIGIDEDLIRRSQEARAELNELDTRIQNNVDVISARLLPILEQGKGFFADLTGEIREATQAIDGGGGLVEAINSLSNAFVEGATGIGPGDIRAGLDSAIQDSDRRQFFGNQANLLNENLNLPPDTRVSQFLGMDAAARALGMDDTEMNFGPGLPPGIFTSPNTIAGITVDPNRGGEGGGPGGGGGSDINVPTPGSRPDLQPPSFSALQSSTENITEAEQQISDLADSIRNKVSGATGEYARQLTELNRAFEAGAIDQETYRQRADQLAQEFSRQTEQAERLDRAADQLGFTFSSAFEDAIVKGENLSSVLQGLAQDITRIAFRQTVTEPGADLLSSAISGGASVFSSFFTGGSSTGGPAVPTSQGGLGQPLPTFAEGGITRGPSLAGERGPEAVVPLPGNRRIPVEMRGGGDVNVQIINQGQPAEVERTERRVQPDGKTQLKVFLRSEIKNAVNDGSLDKPLETNFGLSRQGKR